MPFKALGMRLFITNCNRKYFTEGEWPGADQPLYTLQDCGQCVKEEGRKTAGFVRDADTVLQAPLSVSIWNRISKTAPHVYKSIMMTLLINETGHPIEEVIEKTQQLGDLGEWGTKKNTRSDNRRGEGKENWLSQEEMFAALLEDGMAWDKIDGIPTNEMWRLYKQHELHKSVKRINSSSSDKGDDITDEAIRPSAPRFKPQWDSTLTNRGLPLASRPFQGMKSDGTSTLIFIHGLMLKC